MTLNCKGNLIDLSTPKVMGILNLTPDSFYDGGKFQDTLFALRQVEKMLLEGATFIDIGAYSSRPKAKDINETEELQRLMPVLHLLFKEFPEALVSVDTFRSSVAKEAVAAGACVVNDISAGIMDPNMLQTIADMHVPYIMMHMRGTPQTMALQTDYDNVTKEILFYFSERITAARALGIVDLVVDPGFGFAKTLEQNFEILDHLELLDTVLELPILVGVSRKSMVYNALGLTADKALNGTTVLNTIALQKGASILRVHDVDEAVQSIKLMDMLKQSGS